MEINFRNFKRRVINRAVNYITMSRPYQFLKTRISRKTVIKGVALNLTLLFLYSYYAGSKTNTLQCASEKLKEKINRPLNTSNLENISSIITYNANTPIEDRYIAVSLKNLDGYFLAVLDGHGGHQIAEFAQERLAPYFDDFYKNISAANQTASNETIIVQALNETFAKIVIILSNL